jgi:hypothetical protein
MGKVEQQVGSSSFNPDTITYDGPPPAYRDVFPLSKARAPSSGAAASASARPGRLKRLVAPKQSESSILSDELDENTIGRIQVVLDELKDYSINSQEKKNNVISMMLKNSMPEEPKSIVSEITTLKNPDKRTKAIANVIKFLKAKFPSDVWLDDKDVWLDSKIANDPQAKAHLDELEEPRSALAKIILENLSSKEQFAVAAFISGFIQIEEGDEDRGAYDKAIGLQLAPVVTRILELQSDTRQAEEIFMSFISKYKQFGRHAGIDARSSILGYIDKHNDALFKNNAASKNTVQLLQTFIENKNIDADLAKIKSIVDIMKKSCSQQVCDSDAFLTLCLSLTGVKDNPLQSIKAAASSRQSFFRHQKQPRR